MSADLSVRGLAEMISYLGQMRSEDRAAILDQMDPRLRTRTLGLLAVTPDQGTEHVVDEGVSDWLADKVRTGRGMTKAAHQALLACAGETGGPSAVHQAPRPGRSLLSRVASTLRRPGSSL